MALHLEVPDDLVREHQAQAAAVGLAVMIEDAPHVFTFERDPKDDRYVDLAIAVGAQLIVSRDKDLLSLCDPADPARRDFQTRFPGIGVLTPVELLTRLEAL